jgi:hypothetical protein
VGEGASGHSSFSISPVSISPPVSALADLGVGVGPGVDRCWRRGRSGRFGLGRSGYRVERVGPAGRILRVVSPECARPTRYPVTRLPRRSVLLGLAAALAVPAAGLLAGCGSDEPDPLEALAASARADAALIDSLLNQGVLGAALGARLRPVADARRQHAVALGVELGETTAPSTPASGAPPVPADDLDTEAALARVRSALENSAQEAGLRVLTLPRRQAALAGSIAACCSAYRAVLQ